MKSWYALGLSLSVVVAAHATAATSDPAQRQLQFLPPPFSARPNLPPSIGTSGVQGQFGVPIHGASFGQGAARDDANVPGTRTASEDAAASDTTATEMSASLNKVDAEAGTPTPVANNVSGDADAGAADPAPPVSTNAEHTLGQPTIAVADSGWSSFSRDVGETNSSSPTTTALRDVHATSDAPTPVVSGVGMVALVAAIVVAL